MYKFSSLDIEFYCFVGVEFINWFSSIEFHYIRENKL